MRPAAVLLLLPLALPYPCPIGWRYYSDVNYCLKWFCNATDFISAEQSCMSLGAHLADIHSSEDNHLVANTFEAFTTSWIGINNLMGSNWSWTVPSAYDYDNWFVDPQMPSYSQCGGLDNEDHGWRQFGCEDQMPYICKLAASNYTHTTPEPIICPGDIYCTPGYTLFEGNNLCYKYNITPATPEKNIATCHAEGATLVKIDSAELNEFLLNLSKGFAPIIGLSCSSNNTGDCYWFDGTPLTGYMNFAPGEPGGQDGGGNKTFMSTGVDAGTWITAPYDYGSESLLCQKDSLTAPEYMEALGSRGRAVQDFGDTADRNGVRKSRE